MARAGDDEAAVIGLILVVRSVVQGEPATAEGTFAGYLALAEHYGTGDYGKLRRLIERDCPALLAVEVPDHLIHSFLEADDNGNGKP